MKEEDLVKALSNILLNDDDIDGVDEDMVSYLAGMLTEGHSVEELSENGGEEALGPFLESLGCDETVLTKACDAVKEAASSESSVASKKREVSTDGIRKLGKGAVNMASNLNSVSQHEVDANRFLWGTDSKTLQMTNEQREAHGEAVSTKDRRKQRQELERTRKEFEAQAARIAAEEAEHGKSAVSAMVLPDYSVGRNEKDIQVRNVSLSLDSGTAILDDAELKFAHQRRYGLVGKNGIGKTTLLKAIASMEIHGFPRHHRVLHVRQETSFGASDISVIDAVLQADVERNVLLEEEKELLVRLDAAGGTTGEGDAKSLLEKRQKLQAKIQTSSDGSFEKDLKRLDEVYARLNILSSDSAESRASVILAGLQFTPEMQRGPTSALSGGWRMRVSLAAALFIEPDLLLLDEPTNHLDLEAVLWLESYLQLYRHTLVVVSHDRGFLNEVCTDVIEFKNLKLTYYKGNYDTYVKTSDDNIKNSMRVYQAYQDKRAHMMEFIDKFRCNAKRATLVQSRIKAVEKMDLEAPEPIEIEPVWRFGIPNPEPLGRPIVSIDDASFDYKTTVEGGGKKPSGQYLLQDVNFGIDLDSRIGILGANGAGKSTLLNLIMDKLEPTSGSISRNGRLRIGHFTQHSADKFDLQLSAVENMMASFEGRGDQEMRSFLGKFQIQGVDAVKPMLMLSGGQKSRVAFATLAYYRPHVIIMDEPTNHLDMESIDALVEAVQDFRGGLVVVSHDQFFITSTCGELWVVGEGKATRFRGDFNEYKKLTLERTAKRVAESVKSLSCMNNN